MFRLDIVLRHLSPAQRRVLVIADNQLAIAGAGWDEDNIKIKPDESVKVLHVGLANSAAEAELTPD
jgi:hypothetical protein